MAVDEKPSAAESRPSQLGAAAATGLKRTPDASQASAASLSRRSSSARVVGPVRTTEMPGGTNSGRAAGGEKPPKGLAGSGLRVTSGIDLVTATAADTFNLRERHIKSTKRHLVVTFDRSHQARRRLPPALRGPLKAPFNAWRTPAIRPTERRISCARSARRRALA